MTSITPVSQPENRLIETRVEYKYHMVFAPKYRRRVIYKDITEIFIIRDNGIFKGKKFPDELRKACGPQI